MGERVMAAYDLEDEQTFLVSDISAPVSTRRAHPAWSTVVGIIAISIIAILSVQGASARVPNPENAARLGRVVADGPASPKAATSAPVSPDGCGGLGPYVVDQSQGAIVPGTHDTGNHCDDCVTTIALPFPYTLYGDTYTTANISSEGLLRFVGNYTYFY